MVLNTFHVLFVCTASEQKGFGHLSRCLSLAAYSRKLGFSASFLVFGNALARERAQEAGYECFLFDETCLDTPCSLQVEGVDSDVVIADLFFPGFFSLTGGETLFQELRGLAKRFVIVDVLGEDSILNNFPEVNVDILLSPYLGAAAVVKRFQWRYLEGANYALLGPEYSELPKRNLKVIANRVLVTCGGSDSEGNSLKVLYGLEGINQHLEIRLVIGPLFDNELNEELEKFANKSKHKIILSVAPKSLLKDMLWCDLAISASGLTKYELAACGTPALLFSSDDYHEEANRPFSLQGTCVDLGIGVRPQVIAREVERVLYNTEIRADMAARGKSLIDGKGAQRLFNEIKKELSC